MRQGVRKTILTTNNIADSGKTGRMVEGDVSKSFLSHDDSGSNQEYNYTPDFLTKDCRNDGQATRYAYNAGVGQMRWRETYITNAL